MAGLLNRTGRAIGAMSTIGRRQAIGSTTILPVVGAAVMPTKSCAARFGAPQASTSPSPTGAEGALPNEAGTGSASLENEEQVARQPARRARVEDAGADRRDAPRFACWHASICTNRVNQVVFIIIYFGRRVMAASVGTKPHP
jgi:hypothetical protein